MLSTLEATHNAGYIYNDLKLDNLMIGFGQKLSQDNSIFSDCSLHLVDFGFATKYLDSKGKHIKEGKVNVFRGNIMFASLNQMKFDVTSRRDDLISVCYILVYLLNDGNLLDIDVDNGYGKEECFKLANKAKKI